MGLLDKISTRLTDMRQRARDKKAFAASILAAAGDGQLTEEEMRQIQTRYDELGLEESDLRGVRVKAYQAALRAAKRDGVITTEEEAELAKLQEFLMIPDAEISQSKQELVKLRLLTEIKNGHLPTVSVPNVVFQKQEVPHWAEPASLLEERVVGRHYEGRSSGVSFRIAKGVSYRVGAQRGHLVSERAVVPVSTGELIITSKRVIFRGNTKSFTIRMDKLLELGFYSDGLRLTDDKGKPRILSFQSSENIDVVGAILSEAVNAYNA